MSTVNMANLCPPPFFDARLYPNSKGFVDGRLCQKIADGIQCCLPCPLTNWVYPDSFNTIGTVANWVATASAICCLYLLLSWAFLPVDKTNRHYLSICLTAGVFLMNLGFIVPLAARPEQCYDRITPHGMKTSSVCGASGAFLILGGWSGVMWAFLRSLSLHLQICWQVTVGRPFMYFAQAAGWGIPLIGIVLALVFSGVSFRFGAVCHINHENSLADLWIPLLIFAGITVITTFATFGYCVKVYLASLADNAASTEGSGLPTYSNSIRTMTPRQAYRRVKRVIALQWRGIAIVLIIVADVIFFSVVFVFQDNVVQSVTRDPKVAESWVLCLIGSSGDKNKCLKEAGKFVVNEATVAAVLLLLGLNGVWLVFLLGRRSMLVGWVDLFKNLIGRGDGKKKEFVSVDARLDAKADTRSYEMLSRENSTVVTPASAVQYSSTDRKTSPYHEQTSAQYHAPSRSFSAPRSPVQRSWDAQLTFANARSPNSPPPPPSQSPRSPQQGFERRNQPDNYESMNPLAMNRI
ncbi:GPCR, family 2-like protein [Cordyceps fumosorosea ARSEF 2679]|uniref:GPCR, family 2-like protein n=1 Tax=Cordyceps fumosorosea (strain ARSEF 2679) TaxID=1081104 RepID=A0A162MZW0_CORFA|nr:GPCR, family 2-like protein [Cordyceps fumosorosea ARSEF 2679]OAA73239.1 GPCR, family 2-like protein [Cordyceps fumosorosea ARSEF 2679]